MFSRENPLSAPSMVTSNVDCEYEVRTLGSRTNKDNVSSSLVVVDESRRALARFLPRSVVSVHFHKSGPEHTNIHHGQHDAISTTSDTWIRIRSDPEIVLENGAES